MCSNIENLYHAVLVDVFIVELQTTLRLQSVTEA